MPDSTDTGTGTAETPAPEGAQAPSGEGSQGGQDQVSLLTSRLNGQTAKVGELSNILKTKDQELADALARVKALEEKTVSADEAANARVAELQKAIDAERDARRVDALKARFPESFASLSDQVAGAMDEAGLAALEARLTKGAAAPEPPTPDQHGGARGGTSAGASNRPATADDIEARLMSLPLPDGF